MNKKLIFLIALIFVGCEPGTHFKRSIINNSDHNLEYRYELTNPGSGDAIYQQVTIPKGQTIVIADKSIRDYPSSFENCELIRDNPPGTAFLTTEPSDTFELTNDLNDNTLWRYYLIEKKRRSGECECVLTIENEDFE